MSILAIPAADAGCRVTARSENQDLKLMALQQQSTFAGFLNMSEILRQCVHQLRLLPNKSWQWISSDVCTLCSERGMAVQCRASARHSCAVPYAAETTAQQFKAVSSVC